ncbi:sugar-transfer associated ATP-grasp domain-containing protein [Algibacter sp. L1A34]|uniref:sugar-transfer associated ATP-grasp domain-containing protein n=1 Tax=Algibacter sp. L1A34 TaxID=2686365 RepID=UPI00131D4FE6|nr:sugar-transfer associated ATP-grasp domain-containing protein [Algibacter sp. L1A34]
MKAKLISSSKQFVNFIKKYNYNHSHHLMAKNALKTIESIRGSTNPKLINLSNEYAKDVLGWSGYAPWLKAYSAMVGEFKEGWIPENYFGSIIVPKLQGEVGKTSFLKPLSKKLFNSFDFPDVGCFVNGTFYSENYQCIKDTHVAQYLFKDTDKVVFKINNSAQGMGVIVVDQESFNLSQVKRLGDGVFQKYIKQHSFFNQIMPNSVSTIRVLTVLTNDGKASVRAVYLRVGRNRDSHVMSSSQISIPVDVENGELNNLGHSKSWYTLDTHPDTGFEFRNKKIPNFDKIIKKSLELQSSMPFVKCIGWDLILDENDNVQVMEWNGFHTGIGFAEFTQGPCFKGLGWESLWK